MLGLRLVENYSKSAVEGFDFEFQFMGLREIQGFNKALGKRNVVGVILFPTLFGYTNIQADPHALHHEIMYVFWHKNTTISSRKDYKASSRNNL